MRNGIWLECRFRGGSLVESFGSLFILSSRQTPERIGQRPVRSVFRALAHLVQWLEGVAFSGSKKQIAFYAELLRIQVVIASVRVIELFVGSTLEDSTLLHDQDLIGAADG